MGPLRFILVVSSPSPIYLIPISLKKLFKVTKVNFPSSE